MLQLGMINYQSENTIYLKKEFLTTISACHMENTDCTVKLLIDTNINVALWYGMVID